MTLDGRTDELGLKNKGVMFGKCDRDTLETVVVQRVMAAQPSG